MKWGKIRRYLDTYEATHDYNEYHFDLDEIEHDPYVLISILSVLHEGVFTIDQVQGDLQTLFDKQYILIETVTTETRYRTETRTDSEGNPYTVQVPYTWTICTVTLENFDLSHVPVYMMGEEQLSLYATYMSTLGNRPDLFPSSGYVNKYIENPPTAWEIPAEYLTDERFNTLITEAEKYLGYQDALKRKAEVENQQFTRTFLPPTDQTIAEFLLDFVSLYGEKRWGVSMYDSQNSLISNYINPIIGDLKVQEVTPRVVDKYIQTLQKTPAVSTKMHKAKTQYVTNQTIEKIIKLLRCAFKQAVRWELIAKNPFDNVILPKSEYKKRDIWDAGMIRTALDQCTDSKLYVAMNLSFACSLRMGEILGLTWSNVHISDEEIAADNAYVYIDKELTRASKRAIEMLGQKDIYHVFTPLFPNTSTRVILKKPKTDSSIRKVWLPKTLAYILREWKASQDELRGFLGDEYQDYDLVVALPNGRPCEDRIILKEFEKLREKAGLPRVVFHSLRHSSTTYKLKLNHGDLKATQGDTGHAEIDMITSVYAHILDEDRKINAQKFESAFYANPDLRSVRPPEEKKEPAPAALDLEALVEQLRKSPELANTLAALLSATPGSK